MITLEGFIIPFAIVNGLVHLKMLPFTEDEYQSLVHVDMTQDGPWDPRIYNGELSEAALQAEIKAASLNDAYKAPTMQVNNTTLALFYGNIDAEYPDHLSAGTATVAEAARSDSKP
jgi:hypothetical protein